MSFAPGDVVGDRYELGRQLGAGGMARVYLGHDRLLDRQVAVKVLSEPFASDPQFVERFRREASAAAGLNHPNIVAVYDRGEADGSYYIVMEYLSGPDLKQVVRSRAPLSAVQAIDYTQQILAALGAAHRRDLVHRDVKPQNVLVAEDGHLKVTDFGIARAGAETDMTEAGSVIGTAQYLSPEQARGGEVTAASDCYAVGIVLYELLTGQVPFDGGPPVAVAMKQVSDPPTPPSEIEPGIPPELEAVVLRALAKRPSERYRTAEEMSRALAEVRATIDGSGGPTRVLPAVGMGGDTGRTRVMDPVTGAARVGPPPPVEPPPSRRRRWPIVLGVLVLLAAIGVGAFLFLRGDEARAVTVPRVAGEQAETAQRLLVAEGLEVDRRSVTSATIDQGIVIGTDPAGGAQAHAGDTVIMRVSAGPGQTDVPSVVTMNEADATAALKREQFEVDSQTEASGDVEAGIVISQTPEGGQRADVGSPVTIVVSSGPEQVSVPDVQRQNLSSAEAELKAAGLELGNVAPEENGDFPPDTIIRQDPAPTAKVARGTRVNVTVASAPSEVAVPSGIIGNTATDAKFKLEGLGFDVTSDTAPSDEPVGNVIDVNPGEGTSVPRGSTVTITVSDGPESGSSPEGSDTSGAVPAPPPSSDGRGPDGNGPPGQRR